MPSGAAINTTTMHIQGSAQRTKRYVRNGASCGPVKSELSEKILVEFGDGQAVRFQRWNWPAAREFRSSR